jgi:hypothetical protein
MRGAGDCRRFRGAGAQPTGATSSGIDSVRSAWQKPAAMSVINSVKDVLVDQAMKLAGSPRVTKLMGDPRLMNAAMKAMSLGGSVKTGMDKAGRVAAGVFGLATQEEVATLRATIQSLEDQVASLEPRANGNP